MRCLVVQLLGRFEVTVDARRVSAPAWEQRRAEDLVNLLALSPEHRLTRDEVVEALWLHLGAKAGVANLHKAAHYARKALGWPQAVVLRRGAVELAPGHRVETDVERLESRVMVGQQECRHALQTDARGPRRTSGNPLLLPPLVLRVALSPYRLGNGPPRRP